MFSFEIIFHLKKNAILVKVSFLDAEKEESTFCREISNQPYQKIRVWEECYRELESN